MPSADEFLFLVAQCLLGAPLKTAPAEALALVGPHFTADRAWLIRFDATAQHFWVAYEWCAPGVQAFLPDFLGGAPTALIAHPMRGFLAGKNVVYPDIEKLPPDAQPLKEEMRREGNRATAGAPLFREGKLTALIGLDDTRKVHPWTAAEMNRLRQLGELILAAADRAETSLPALAPRQPEGDEPAGCYIRAGHCHIQVRWEEILLISAEGDHSRVRLAGGRDFFELKALSAWQAMLPADRFSRVHRSHIVHWPHVRRLRRTSGGRWSLELADLPPIPVGRSYQPEVRQRINLRPV